MAKQEIIITFEGSPIEAAAFQKTAQKLADMPKEDLKRFSMVIVNAKAAKALKQYWSMLLKFA